MFTMFVAILIQYDGNGNMIKPPNMEWHTDKVMILRQEDYDSLAVCKETARQMNSIQENYKFFCLRKM